MHWIQTILLNLYGYCVFTTYSISFTSNIYPFTFFSINKQIPSNFLAYMDFTKINLECVENYELKHQIVNVNFINI